MASDAKIICNECALTLDLPEGLSSKPLLCPRCHFRIKSPKKISRLPTIVLSLTALILYVPAMMLPFLTTEFYGQANHATIWTGVVQLFESQAYVVATVIFLASMVFPLVKIIGLLYLSIFSRPANANYNTWLYRVIEYLGRWSMLDIFVLAILVTTLKIRELTDVQPEIGSLLFALVVVFTMLASAQFNPQTLWTKYEERKVY